MVGSYLFLQIAMVAISWLQNCGVQMNGVQSSLNRCLSSFTALTQPFVNKQIFFWGPKQLFRYGELVELGFGHPEQVSGVKNARK